MRIKQKAIVSKKLRESARGQACQVRLPDICNHNPETTVLAHINGGGAAMKSDDIEAAYACSACHDEIDRRARILDFDLVLLYHYEGCKRTRRIMYDQGLIQIVGDKNQ